MTVILTENWDVNCFDPSSLYLFFFFSFIFKLYNIVLVLPNIEMNPPWVYMCSPSWFIYFWPCCVACRILVPQPGLEPIPHAMGVQSLNHWIARELSHLPFKTELKHPLFSWWNLPSSLFRLIKVLWAELFLFESSHVEVLTLNIIECDHIWR